MSCSLFERSLYFFSYDGLYTYFVQCVEYNNGEQPHMLIPTIQNLEYEMVVAPELGSGLFPQSLLDYYFQEYWSDHSYQNWILVQI
jgi:hypothetical protein